MICPSCSSTTVNGICTGCGMRSNFQAPAELKPTELAPQVNVAIPAIEEPAELKPTEPTSKVEPTIQAKAEIRGDLYQHFGVFLAEVMQQWFAGLRCPHCGELVDKE